MSIKQDITSHFTRFSKHNQKIFHESFIILNSISWRDIDFDHSYVITYNQRKTNEKFDLLKHSKDIPFFEYFKYKCKLSQKFHPYKWQYDTHHNNRFCPFERRCEYFKLLQSVDKSLPKNEKLGSLNIKGSLMRFKKLFCQLKLDYDIFLYLKTFNSTNSTIYKNETELLKQFKQNVIKRKKKQTNININIDKEINLINNRINQQEEYKLQSPKWQPKSLSI